MTEPSPTQPRPNLVEPQLLNFHGLQIAMRVQGEGPPLLLMNGMTRPMGSWDRLAHEVHGRTVISFDAPGLGDSPTPSLPLSIRGLAALAVAVLDAAGVGDSDVLGFSHGGAVAQQLALDAPDRVRRLILVSTSCGVGATPGRRGETLHAIGTPAPAYPWPLPNPLGMLWQLLAFSSWSSIPFLGAIRAPTLVVCGAGDRIVPRVNSQVLAGRIPDASLVVLAGGHDLQRSKTASGLARIVEHFLRAPRNTH